MVYKFDPKAPKYYPDTYSVIARVDGLSGKTEKISATQKLSDDIIALAQADGCAASVKVTVFVPELGFLQVNCPEGFSKKIKALPNVKSIEPTPIRHLMGGPAQGM